MNPQRTILPATLALAAVAAHPGFDDTPPYGENRCAWRTCSESGPGN